VLLWPIQFKAFQAIHCRSIGTEASISGNEAGMSLCVVALTFQIGRSIDSMALMQVTRIVMQLMFKSRRDTSALALVLTTSRAIQRRRHTKRLRHRVSGIAALVVYCWPDLKLVVVLC